MSVNRFVDLHACVNNILGKKLNIKWQMAPKGSTLKAQWKKFCNQMWEDYCLLASLHSNPYILTSTMNILRGWGGGEVQEREKDGGTNENT